MLKTSPWPPNCELCPDDLKRLSSLHDLLRALNDPFVSRSKLQMLTASIPVLAARVVHLAKVRWPSVDGLPAALQRIGNRGLEQILLEFLEDLTMYKDRLDSDAEDTEKDSATKADGPTSDHRG